MRDKVGSFRSRESMESWLNEWILNYVDGDPANSSEETKARRPLAAAQVEVEEDRRSSLATTSRGSSSSRTTSSKA